MNVQHFVLTAALAFAIPVSSRAADVNEIIIEAHVDGGSALHVRPSSIYWENGDAAKPGRMNLLDEPTYVNGAAWTPRWKNQKEDRGKDKSAPYQISIGTADLEFELLSVTEQRGEAGILKRTPVVAKREGGEFVVTIPDSETGGCWYKFVLRKKKK